MIVRRFMEIISSLKYFNGVKLHKDCFGCFLLSTVNRLQTLYRLFPTAYCLFPTAYCLLPIAYCLLPVSIFRSRNYQFNNIVGRLKLFIKVFSKCSNFPDDFLRITTLLYDPFCGLPVVKMINKDNV